MLPHVVTAGPSASASQAALQPTIGRFSGLPITDPNQALVGIVTGFDLLRALKEGRNLDTIQVFEVMNSDLITVDASAPIDDLTKVLQRERIIRVPIVSDGQLVGIVSRGDVLKAAFGSKLALYHRDIS